MSRHLLAPAALVLLMAFGCTSREAGTDIPDSALPNSAESGSSAGERLPSVRVNGVDLHYVERGSGEPIVFIHGASRTTESGSPWVIRWRRGIGPCGTAAATTSPTTICSPALTTLRPSKRRTSLRSSAQRSSRLPMSSASRTEVTPGSCSHSGTRILSVASSSSSRRSCGGSLPCPAAKTWPRSSSRGCSDRLERRSGEGTARARFA